MKALAGEVKSASRDTVDGLNMVSNGLHGFACTPWCDAPSEPHAKISSGKKGYVIALRLDRA